MELESATTCTECGRPLSLSHIEIDASGTGYTLNVTNVPVMGCSHCRSSLRMSHFGKLSVDAIVMASVNALETLAPLPHGDFKHSAYQCRNCKTKLPNSVDQDRAHFRANAAIGRTSEVVGVDYYGDAVTCPSCATKHPHLSPALYHKIKDSIARTASLYLPH